MHHVKDFKKKIASLFKFSYLANQAAQHKNVFTFILKIFSCLRLLFLPRLFEGLESRQKPDSLIINNIC